jgi:hypothetical protein
MAEKLVIEFYFDKANVSIFDIKNINTYAKILNHLSSRSLPGG